MSSDPNDAPQLLDAADPPRRAQPRSATAITPLVLPFIAPIIGLAVFVLILRANGDAADACSTRRLRLLRSPTALQTCLRRRHLSNQTSRITGSAERRLVGKIAPEVSGR